MFITQVVRALGIRYPFKIELVSKGHKKAHAYYWSICKNGGKGKLHSHFIRIYLGDITEDSRSYEQILAHEFIHAWQEEQGIDEYQEKNGVHMFHGPQFIEMADKLGYILGLENIYLKGIDL